MNCASGCSRGVLWMRLHLLLHERASVLVAPPPLKDSRDTFVKWESFFPGADVWFLDEPHAFVDGECPRCVWE